MAQGGPHVPYSSLRSKTYPLSRDTLRLDSLNIVPGSLQIPGVTDAAYNLLPENSLLIWKQRPKQDSIRINYRVLPIDLHHRYYHKDLRQIDSIYGMYVYHPNDTGRNGNFVNFNQIEYNGSYGRSIALGNSQDVVLNSNFNFQASGYILDSVRLDAAITDNTVPFQPEGNTQRLQEFDQVFIRLQKKQQILQLGDFTIDRPKSYFLNFNKRVQGIGYQNSFKIGDNTVNTASASASIAKGEFARNIFDGLEGNQGPYKLTGNSGEQFFIVLAGTEKVYINGLLQQRGEQADYIINYNTGEIQFMPRRLITKDSRIQIEFEYQDRNYLNSLLYAWDDLQHGKKWNMHFNAYSNQDAKNQPYQQTLDGDQKRFLEGVGDSIQNAYYPVIAKDTFAASKILYKIKDSLVNGVMYDTVFVYSTSPDSAQYTLSFSFVTLGHGDYVISNSNANGRVYDWIPPVNGHHQGDYAPVQLLITPKLQQVFTLSGTYNIDSLKSLYVEGSLSNYDPNLFSSLDNNTHVGLAAKLKYTELRLFGSKDSNKRYHDQWQNDVSYEFVQQNFHAVSPYRNVEFGRDWNVPQDQTIHPEEHLATWATQLRDITYGNLSYALNYYRRGDTYNGVRNVLGYTYNKKGLNAGFVADVLTSKDTSQTAQFIRPTVFAEYMFKNLLHTTIGSRFYEEHDALKGTVMEGDTLLTTGYANNTTTIYAKTPDEQPINFSLGYTLRNDLKPLADEFAQLDHSGTVSLTAGVTKIKNQVITLTATYRKLTVDNKDSVFNGGMKNEETLLGRLGYNGATLRHVFSWQILYEFGSGQEQKRSYTFVQVPAGQGLYTWIDYNGDGVQQSNEFELALYPDQKTYIKVLTLTNEYVKVNYTNFNTSLNIDPSSYWKEKQKGGFNGFLCRFSDQASLQINNRLLADAGFSAYNPFKLALNDSDVITTSNSVNNTLYFNRTNTKAGFDYNYLRTAGKQLLTYGVEGNSTSQHTGRFRYNLNSSFTLNLTGRDGARGYQSALDDGRTYRIHTWSAQPAITWLYRSLFRITTSVQYDDRYNEAAYGGEKAKVNSLDLDMRYTKAASGAIQVHVTYSNITYDGVAGTPVAYSMLEALTPGANYLWNLRWDRRVGKGIELSVEYEGRKPGTGTVVHTGRMTLRAVL